MSLAEAWERNAGAWATLVRSGGDRLYERNLTAFRELLPPPGRLTVDVGCGEGRRISRSRSDAATRLRAARRARANAPLEERAVRRRAEREGQPPLVEVRLLDDEGGPFFLHLVAQR